MLPVGKVLKAHGVKGEVKAECYTDAPSDLLSVKRLLIDGKEYPVEKIREQGGFLLVKLRSVEDMNAAETLRGKTLFAEKADLPALPQGRFYIRDVVGSVVFVENERLGKLTDVLQYGSADVFVVKTPDGGDVLFPYVGDVVSSVDVEDKKIVLNAAEFAKVAVYED